MKRTALVAVDAEPARFAALIAAARDRGVRIGWLDLRDSAPVRDADLEQAAGAGAARSVAVGGGRVMSVKPISGPAVLRDLIREHFPGCRIVLVRGRGGYPGLAPAGGGYRLEVAAGRDRELDPAATLAELLRPVHAPDRRRERRDGGA